MAETKSKDTNRRISGPEELDKILKRTNPLVWIVLVGNVVLLLLFFLWAILGTVKQETEMTAIVSEGSVSIYAGDNIGQVKEGQKVYIEGETGTIVSVTDDGTILISDMPLDDGAYTCNIVIREIKPIEFLLDK